jgi:hypothetical protein
MKKEKAKERLDEIITTLGDGDCMRFYSRAECEALSAEGRRICEEFGFDMPWRIRLDL